MKVKEEFKDKIKVISKELKAWQTARDATQQRIDSMREGLLIDEEFLLLCEQKIAEEKNKKS